MVIPLRYETCSVRCYHLMTTVRAWWTPPSDMKHLHQISLSHDSNQSKVIPPPPPPYKAETCSISCHYLLTTVRAWCALQVWNMLRQLSSSYVNHQSMVPPPQIWNMLCQFSSSSDNGQSMVISPSGKKYALSVVNVLCQPSEHGATPSDMKHAPSVLIDFWQRSEHGNTTSGKKHALSFFIVSWQRSEHDFWFLMY